MGADLASFNAILKEDYLDPIRDVLNSKTLLLHRLQRNSEDIRGLEAYIPLNKSRNEGVGSRAENGTLPTAGQQGYDKARFGMKYHYGRIQISGPTIEAAATDEGAFTRAVDSESRGLVRDVLKDINRQLFGNGEGVLAIPITEVTDTFIANSPVAGYATNVAAALQHLRVGMIVDVIVRATGVLNAGGDGRTITAINKTTGLVTFNAGTDLTALSTTHAVIRTRSAGVDVSHEMFGLDAAIRTTNPDSAAAGQVVNFGLIDRTAAGNDFWHGNEMANAGVLRAFDVNMFEEAIDTVDIEGDGEISIWIGSHAMHRKYAQQLIPDRRYTTQEGNFSMLDGGFKALEYDGIPVVKDRDCQPGRFYGLDESTFMIFEMSDWQWMDKDGAVLSRVSGVDAYEATLYKYMQLGCDDPRNSIVIKDLQEA